jgi:cystinosin
MRAATAPRPRSSTDAPRRSPPPPADAVPPPPPPGSEPGGSPRSPLRLETTARSGGSPASPLLRAMSSDPLLPPPAEPEPGAAPAAPARRAARLEPLLWALGPWAAGAALAAALRARDPALPPPLDMLSPLVGWVYFCAWSVSFYPQIALNWRRRSVAGLSVDFQLLNFLGFACYAAYTSALLWSPAVRAEYAARSGGRAPAVHPEDAAFALHAAAATGVTLAQCAAYGGGGRPARATLVAAAGAAGAAAAWAAAVALARGGGGAGAPPLSQWLSWLPLVSFLSAVKVAITLTKYAPQLLLNARRRSTAGWHLWSVLLDLEGGLLSAAQLAGDAAAARDWGALGGNAAKLALGGASVFYDAALIAQHRAFARRPGARGGGGARGGALGGDPA